MDVISSPTLWNLLLVSNLFVPHSIPLMFAVISKPYEGFRGCFLASANNSTRETYIFLTVVEGGEYVEETNVSCRFLYL
jgi:hypothetical protein